VKVWTVRVVMVTVIVVMKILRLSVTVETSYFIAVMVSKYL
jgi:hypothetical protein